MSTKKEKAPTGKNAAKDKAKGAAKISLGDSDFETTVSSFGEEASNIDSGTEIQTEGKNNLVVIGNRNITLKSISGLESLLNFVKVNNDKKSKAEYVIIRDTLYVLTEGSRLTFKEDDSWSGLNAKHVEEGDVSVGNLPIIYLENSRLAVSWGHTIKGKNYLSGTRIESAGDVIIDDSTITKSTLSADAITVNKSKIDNCHLKSTYINITDSNFKHWHGNARNRINITKYKCAWGDDKGYFSIPRQAVNLRIEPNHDIFVAEFNIPTYCKDEYASFDINVITRIDYGRFNGVKPVNFVRCNTADILVGSLYLESDKFDQAYQRLHSELTDAPYFASSDNKPCNLKCEEFLNIARGIRELAVGDGKSDKYTPDRNNRIENGLILGFIDQVQSRINLYKQVGFLVNG